MNGTVNGALMMKDFSRQDLRNMSFRNKDLRGANFADSDLRGADFTGANLAGADLTNTTTGMTPKTTFWIFAATVCVSIFSGYMAMLAGRVVELMVTSDAQHVRAAGYLAMINILLFVILSLWKGVGKAIATFIVPTVLFALVVGIVSYASGYGNGQAAAYLILALLLVAVMFIVGTIARATAGSVSTILFWVVALSGASFGRSLGGGLGTVILAISCAHISQQALHGAKRFGALRKIAFFVTTKFGTSFRNSKLSEADFSKSVLHNADFTNADTSHVRWGNTKKVHCKE